MPGRKKNAGVKLFKCGAFSAIPSGINIYPNKKPSTEVPGYFQKH
jgi:hypothetical protein